MSGSEEEKLLSQLKEILLDEDREEIADLEGRLQKIIDLLENAERFGERVKPHVEVKVDNQLVDMKENFNSYFGPQLTVALQKQIEDSQDTVIEALYPIIGKLIRKFIQSEINKLVERVDSQVSSTFSFQNFKRKIVGIFTGVNESELALAELNAPIVQEVFIIQKESGLLLGSFSRNDTIDQDMIAGMMTAIKSFAEDAFKRTSDELETIQYESLNILLQSFYSTYMAVVVSGVVDTGFKEDLRDKCMDFSGQHLNKPFKEVTEEVSDTLSSALNDFFNE